MDSVNGRGWLHLPASSVGLHTLRLRCDPLLEICTAFQVAGAWCVRAGAHSVRQRRVLVFCQGVWVGNLHVCLLSSRRLPGWETAAAFAWLWGMPPGIDLCGGFVAGLSWPLLFVMTQSNRGPTCMVAFIADVWRVSFVSVYIELHSPVV
jgi:hypothetical protein